MWPQPHIRILLTRYAAFRWVARSLEHDIVVEGRGADAAVQALRQIICAHVSFDRRHHRPLLGAFPPAPARVWNAFEHATPIWQQTRTEEDDVAFAIALAEEDPSWAPLDESPAGSEPALAAVHVKPS